MLDNTLIILLSDNGGNGEPGIEGRFAGKNPGSAGEYSFSGCCRADVANAPFFLYKHHGHEGGCNTPFIVSYPNGIDKSLNGTIQKRQLRTYSRYHAYFGEKLTGATYPSSRGGHKVPPMEGISLLPLLKGEPVKANQTDHCGTRRQQNAA